jgi:hypothetical protein
MKYLISFLISFNVYSANFIVLKPIVCGEIEVFTKLGYCEKKSNLKCIEMPEDFNCNFHEIKNNKIIENEIKKTQFKNKEESRKTLELTKAQDKKNELEILKNSLDNINDPLIKKFIKRLYEDYYKEK